MNETVTWTVLGVVLFALGAFLSARAGRLKGKLGSGRAFFWPQVISSALVGGAIFAFIKAFVG